MRHGGLSSLIGELPLPGHSQLVLFDEVGTLLATDPERLPSFEQLSACPCCRPSITPFSPGCNRRWLRGLPCCITPPS
nr:hypothetical protein [Aeromonas caviae]